MSDAGYFEYAYLQSEWIEFYLRLGINIMLWNYRGFGRTKGFPRLSKFPEDAASIVEYLKASRGITSIGVHGEGFGGIIAARLASRLPLNFLFADRSVWSLGITSYFKYGKAVDWLLKFTCSDSWSVADDYLRVNCYKVISCDSLDAVVNDLGSLKSGVTFALLGQSLGIEERRIFYQKTAVKIGYILSNHEIKSVYQALVRLTKMMSSGQ